MQVRGHPSIRGELKISAPVERGRYPQLARRPTNMHERAIEQTDAPSKIGECKVDGARVLGVVSAVWVSAAMGASGVDAASSW